MSQRARRRRAAEETGALARNVDSALEAVEDIFRRCWKCRASTPAR